MSIIGGGQAKRVGEDERLPVQASRVVEFDGKGEERVKMLGRPNEGDAARCSHALTHDVRHFERQQGCRDDRLPCPESGVIESDSLRASLFRQQPFDSY